MTAAAAHDQAINRSGKTVTPADVLKAISELDFGPADQLIPLLERELAGMYIIFIADQLTEPTTHPRRKQGRVKPRAGPFLQCCIAISAQAIYTTYLFKEALPLIQCLALLLIQARVICDSVFGVEGRHAQTLARIFSCKDVIAPSYAVHLLLVGYVKHPAFDSQIDRLGGVCPVVFGKLRRRDGIVLHKLYPGLGSPLEERDLLLEQT